MVVGIINPELKKNVITCLLKGDLASLPECIHRSEKGLSMKYDEIQLEERDDFLLIHNCYKNEILNTTSVHTWADHIYGTVTVADLVLRMDSGEKVNCIDLNFENSPKIKVSLFKIRKKTRTRKLVNTFVIQKTKTGICSISGFLGLHPWVLT